MISITKVKEDQQIEDHNLDVSDNYLSSIGLDDYKKEERKEQEEDEEWWQKEKQKNIIEKIEISSETKEFAYFIFRFIVSFIEYLFGSILVTLFVIIYILESVFGKSSSFNWSSLWSLLSCACITYALINFFFLDISNFYVKRLYQDGVFFILSALLVYSYIKAQHHINKSLIHDVISCVHNLTKIEGKKLDFKQDFSSKMEDGDHDEIAGDYPVQKVRLFSFTRHLEVERDHILQYLENDYYTHDVEKYQLIILSIIILLKLIGIFYYVYVHSFVMKDLDIIGIVDMILMISVYLQVTSNLLNTLGNYDLRKKTKEMQHQTTLIKFDYLTKDNYEHLVDVTNSCSLEAYDSTRKRIFLKQIDYLERLDYAYFGLIFYYLFVIIVCVSYFFDLDWLISKESHLLDSISVIMSTGNFIFISAFLVFRLKHGTDFNNTFQELEIAVDNLLDVVDDLATMYDQFFRQDKNTKSREQREEQEKIEFEREEEVEVIHLENDDEQKTKTKEEEEKEVIYKLDKIERFTVYGLLVKKIKLMSRVYIEKKLKYQGKLYQRDEIHDLRLKILENMKTTINKVKASVQTDSKLYKYKFMGVMEVDVSSFLFTIIFGVVTSLPSIIPKFIAFYQ